MTKADELRDSCGVCQSWEVTKENALKDEAADAMDQMAGALKEARRMLDHYGTRDSGGVSKIVSALRAAGYEEDQ